VSFRTNCPASASWLHIRLPWRRCQRPVSPTGNLKTYAINGTYLEAARPGPQPQILIHSRKK